ncbi:MAG: DNA polymerase sliding clamp [Candidatus Nanoarchaeia archaeon]|nr:DNA polymerase sliding clamp [Candidatus Haiyanarchaeum thermophilum]MCW1303060.1 DNA polymerase sliding clamp [Candidatus Haiyanarchaeum thermophilum]MCW1303725.1 DNA polymerase sliding clamp [Candidatus Haiyanarchaeum thermophilum]MCW1306830.1 DNA polymerase sliding clamp [Candidatus Haiyanarchaeum thermophilum]MCW1308925.1 DNA polymerase sliding clamp [Candidatus Haiyanarchaeum thermophilum]
MNALFRLVTNEVGIIRDSFDTISSLVSEGTFHISKDGVKLVAIDPSNVAMVIFNLFSIAFSEYEVKEETPITVNIEQLVKVLKRAKASDQIVFQLDESKSRLMIQMLGTVKRYFSIPLIGTVESETKVPEFDRKFTTKIELDAEILEDSIKDAEMISDSLTFEATKDKFVLYASGDSSEVRTELTRDSPSLISLDVSESSRAKYSIEYLSKAIKAAKIADTLIIQFKTDFPIRLDFKAVDKLQISFIIAPRVD